MGKAGKVVIFIVVALLLAVLATVMKEAGAGAVMSIAGVAIFILYQAMFKKSEPDEKANDSDSDITLKK